MTLRFITRLKGDCLVTRGKGLMAVISILLGCLTTSAQSGKFIFPGEVEPLLTTEWGQEYPYNRKCPTVLIDSVEKHVYAGCGPLVMSQVIRYYRQPQQSQALKHRYAWELMFDRASDTSTIAQQDAVAQLIRDCGTAAATNYSQSASSTKLNSVVLGLKKYFGYNRHLHIADRAYFPGKEGDRAWKTIIYNELQAGRPIIIRGEKSARNAHVFIIDGCRDSTVHVNWGWNGWRNGYYDPDSLYGYRANQRMVTGITPKDVLPTTKRIDVESPGRLAAHITSSDWITMSSLKVTGHIGKDDVRLLRKLAGGDGKNGHNGNLSTIDLSESVILTLPDSAFYGCENLTYISLPITLPEISSYAFANCTKLNNIRIYPLVNEIKLRAFSGCFNLIEIKLPQALRAIGANAFNSCNSLTSVTVPPNVTSIGSGAFAYAAALRQLLVPKTVKNVNDNIIKGTKVQHIKRI